MTAPTTIGGYAQVFANVLEERGIDYRVVFDQAGVTLAESTDPLSRISSEAVSKLFEIAIGLTGDPYLGIEIGKGFQPGHFHALGYGLLSSTTLRDFFQRIEKYYRIASQNAEFTHFDRDGVSVLCAAEIKQQACPEAEDVWATAMFRFMRMVYQKPLRPAFINFRRPCPAPGPQPYIDFFGCDVRFDCDSAQIGISGELMDRRLPAASEELARHHDRIVMDYQDKLDKTDTVTRVRRLIVRELSSGAVTKSLVAGELGMSTRSMQMKLAAADCSFQALLEECRRDLALGYMTQSHLSITEIAYLLGFADASNFTRAFRRWTGSAPSKYRATLPDN